MRGEAFAWSPVSSVLLLPMATTRRRYAKACRPTGHVARHNTAASGLSGAARQTPGHDDFSFASGQHMKFSMATRAASRHDVGPTNTISGADGPRTLGRYHATAEYAPRSAAAGPISLAASFITQSRLRAALPLRPSWLHAIISGQPLRVLLYAITLATHHDVEAPHGPPRRQRRPMSDDAGLSLRADAAFSFKNAIGAYEICRAAGDIDLAACIGRTERAAPVSISHEFSAAR